MKDELFSMIQKDFYSNIFVIGPTECGKSTLCKEIEKIDDTHVFYRHISIGNHFKQKFPNNKKEGYTDYLTQKCKELLAKNPDYVINFYKEKGNCHGGGMIIDGLRNPRDFVHLFDFNQDLVIFVERDGFEIKNEFEAGIDVIKNYVEWLKNNFKNNTTFHYTLKLSDYRLQGTSKM